MPCWLPCWVAVSCVRSLVISLCRIPLLSRRAGTAVAPGNSCSNESAHPPDDRTGSTDTRTPCRTPPRPDATGLGRSAGCYLGELRPADEYAEDDDDGAGEGNGPLHEGGFRDRPAWRRGGRSSRDRPARCGWPMRWPRPDCVPCRRLQARGRWRGCRTCSRSCWRPLGMMAFPDVDFIRNCAIVPLLPSRRQDRFTLRIDLARGARRATSGRAFRHSAFRPVPCAIYTET